MKRGGVIFTMDAIMAIILVFLIVIAVQTQMGSVDMSYWDYIYAQELGGDIIYNLDALGSFESLDSDNIRSNVTNLLPPNYDMWLQIKVYDYGDGFKLNQTIIVGTEPSEDLSIVSGRSIYLSGADEIEKYNLIKYKIWSK